MVNIENYVVVFFFQAEDGIRDTSVTGVQTCALPILAERIFGWNGCVKSLEVVHSYS